MVEDPRVLLTPSSNPLLTISWCWRRRRRRRRRLEVVLGAVDRVPDEIHVALRGKMVHLCGSFTNWLETVPMAPNQTPNGNQVFSVVCNLPPGYHQYKFIVDGEWRHDENQAFIQDPLGNVNNWLFVKKPSGHGGSGAYGTAPCRKPESGGGIGSPGMTNAEMQSAQTGGGAYIQQQQMMQQQQNYQQGTAPLEVPGMMFLGGSSGMSGRYYWWWTTSRASVASPTSTRQINGSG